MADLHPGALPPRPPIVAAPKPVADRRVAHRRTADRVANQERLLLARTLDVLASEATAEERLAGVLRLLARTVGARRAAVIADGGERRAAVAVNAGEDPRRAGELAAWLDAHGPRSRAQRAGSGPAPISFIVAAREDASAPAAPIQPSAASHEAGSSGGESRRAFAMLRIPTAGDVALGFEFGRAADAATLATRLPPQMARHAAVALALVTSELARERELAALRAAEAERATFVSTVAHELRTPLTGLRGYLELILEGQVPDRDTELEFLDRSRSIVGSMSDLVGDLLELSRLESGTVELDRGPFSIAEALSQVAASLLPIAVGRGIRLTTTLPSRLRAAMGDRRRVEQIVTNLAANALKFGAEGGHVEIEGEARGLAPVVVVRDDGSGIPAEDRSRIFERFHRMAAHERIDGTGLGLPIARDLARRMGGDLDVASVPGSGSAFVLVLPGPTGADAAAVAATLAEALEREEVALEERVVRRAMAVIRDEAGAASRPSVRTDRGGDRRVGPRAVPLDAEPRSEGDPGHGGSGAGNADVVRIGFRTSPPVRLRSVPPLAPLRHPSP
ncbi:MAG TPA: HAMP domain-containing sensor histidine kinase [Candidatus Limnocylindrales bacterium]|nr:HAMP domain-containing sensor histidine kinase [Candidatus Limnocylindrales bacterium]